MGNPSAAQEPSMEEILASIRQIISEDDEGAPAPDARPPHAPHASGNGHGAQERPTGAPAAASHAAGRAEPEKPARPAPAHVQAAPRAAPPREAAPAPGHSRASSAVAPAASREERGLLSHGSDAAVSGAFNALAHTILSQNARTLEDLVVEMLRPMLSDWLDENLPPLVERLVREEIERVSRGRR